MLNLLLLHFGAYSELLTGTSKILSLKFGNKTQFLSYVLQVLPKKKD